MENDDTQVDDLDTTLEDTDEDTQESEEQDTAYWKAEALKNKAILDRQKHKNAGKVEKRESTPESKPKSADLDYGQKSFLIASGYKDKSEMKLAQEIMKESGRDLETVIESKYFLSEVENMRELKKTADATPTGKRTANTPSDSVEYWMTKPLEDVPKEMRIKVINAQVAQSKNKGVFYNS
jgi:hypothetical protein